VLYNIVNIYPYLGKRGPKSKFTDVACSNEACKDRGVDKHGNIISNGTYKQETQQFTDIGAIVAGKYSVIVQILFIITFAQTNLPSI
jgi:hypothetical protein